MTFTPAQLWAMLGFLGVVAGSFMPWAKVGIFTANGTDGDGVITLALGAIAIVLLLTSTRGAAQLAVILALLAGGIGIYDAAHVSDAIDEANATSTLFTFDAEVGTGLYLVIVASIVAFIATIRRAGELAPVAVPPASDLDPEPKDKGWAPPS